MSLSILWESTHGDVSPPRRHLHEQRLLIPEEGHGAGGAGAPLQVQDLARKFLISMTHQFPNKIFTKNIIFLDVKNIFITHLYTYVVFNYHIPPICYQVFLKRFPPQTLISLSHYFFY